MRFWGIVKRVYGRDGKHGTCYLTRIKLTPRTRWGQLYFHVFHRGDADRDPHDHPYDFWTFPLRTYYEDVFNLVTGRSTRNAVTAFHIHFRPAEYTHIQLGAARIRWVEQRRENIFGGWTVTFVWHKPTRRRWGFWEGDTWTHWKEYLGVND